MKVSGNADPLQPAYATRTIPIKQATLRQNMYVIIFRILHIAA